MRTLVLFLGWLVFPGLLFPGTKTPHTETENRFHIEESSLHTGDIVLRSGKGFVSDLFRKSSKRDQQYSHSGIIRMTPNGAMVYHIIGGTHPGNKSDLMIEPLSTFCDSRNTVSCAVFEYDFLKEKEEAVNTFLDNLSIQKPVFDDDFDLATTDKLYCTELIYQMCLQTASVKLPSTIFNSNSYIALDNLYLNSFTTKLYQTRF